MKILMLEKKQKEKEKKVESDRCCTIMLVYYVIVRIDG